jgi:hypothetical protein
MDRRLLLIALLAAGSAQAAEPRLTEAGVRDFVARQEAAWNGKDAQAFATTFTSDAVFVAQARDSHGGITANGKSTLPEAIAQARRFFARSSFRETGVVDRVVMSPDGRSAQVFGHQATRIETPGRPSRTLCGQTGQTVVLVKGRILSHGQTDTDVRCPR